MVTLVWFSSAKEPHSIHLFHVRHWKHVFGSFFLMDVCWEISTVLVPFGRGLIYCLMSVLRGQEAGQRPVVEVLTGHQRVRGQNTDSPQEDQRQCGEMLRSRAINAGAKGQRPLIKRLFPATPQWLLDTGWSRTMCSAAYSEEVHKS